MPTPVLDLRRRANKSYILDPVGVARRPTQEILDCTAVPCRCRLDSCDRATSPEDNERLATILDRIEHVRKPACRFRRTEAFHNIRLSELTVLGVEVTVASVDLVDSGQIVAICCRGGMRQAISILDLPLPTPPPEGAEWIEAYRRWRGC